MGSGASLQTLELATSLFDRYMAFLNQPLVDRDELELLCVACVSLATKFHEVQSYLLTEPYYANDAERDRVVERGGPRLASIEWNVRLKDSLVENVFDATVPGNDGNHRSVVRRAFQSVWRHMYFLQGFSSLRNLPGPWPPSLRTRTNRPGVDHFLHQADPARCNAVGRIDAFQAAIKKEAGSHQKRTQWQPLLHHNSSKSKRRFWTPCSPWTN